VKHKVESPYLFELVNSKGLKKTHVGVREFTGLEGCIHVPLWMMAILGLKEEDSVLIKSYYEAIKGTAIHIRPEKTEFILLGNHKAILENQIKNYVMLTEGEDILIKHLNKDYTITITKCLPTKVINTIDTNINIEFEEPSDYQDYLKKQELSKSKTTAPTKQPAVVKKEEEKKFTGNSTSISSDVQSPQKNSKASIIVPKSAYNPKDKRLKNGIVIN
jgi:Ubiquitin fusion degradation protein UFD1